MKKYLAFAILFMACNSKPEPIVLDMPITDSVLAKSVKNSDSAVVILKFADKKSEEKVQQIIQNVTEMKSEITQLNKVINESKKLSKVIHDTIYVTEKKNFWGKTKKTIDSTKKQIDSTENQ